MSWKKTRARELLTVETKLDTATGFEENWTLEDESTSVLKSDAIWSGGEYTRIIHIHATCTVHSNV